MRKLQWSLFSVLFFSQFALTVENKLPPQEGDHESGSLILQEESQIEIDSNQEVGNKSNPTVAEEGGKGESADRFIPTEEISQDLGVSFPVDI